MESTIFAVIGEWLIARIDDCAVELHPLINVVHDVIRPLAELEVNRLFARWDLEIESERVGLSNSACAGENLAGGQEGEQSPERSRSELCLAPHEVILVATEGSPGVMVDVVLDE